MRKLFFLLDFWDDLMMKQHNGLYFSLVYKQIIFMVPWKNIIE